MKSVDASREASTSCRARTRHGRDGSPERFCAPFAHVRQFFPSQPPQGGGAHTRRPQQPQRRVPPALKVPERNRRKLSSGRVAAFPCRREQNDQSIVSSAEQGEDANARKSTPETLRHQMAARDR